MLELEHVKQLGDEVLIERLTQSVQRDRQLSVELLIVLSEVQERGLYRDLGFATMFDYATRRLRMSESEAALRLRAAKLARAFPIALEMLERCEIHLTALGILAPVLTPDRIALLYEARFKTKQQVLELIAKYTPKPDVPDSIRRLPRPSPNKPSARAPQVQNARPTPLPVQLPAAKPPMQPTAATPPMQPAVATPPMQLAAPTQPMQPAAVTLHVPTAASTLHGPHVGSTAARANTDELLPLSPDRHKIVFTASQRVRDILEEARELRRHRDPTGQLEPLFERALELLIADEKKRRFGQTAKPRQARQPLQAEQARLTAKPRQPQPAEHARPTQPAEHARPPQPAEHARQPQPAEHARPLRRAASPNLRSRYIPAEVRRHVWHRDVGQCCFRAPDGTRCSARSRLEFHHKIPFERGGPTRTDNLELMCTSHNALLAERDYGRAFILHVRHARSHAVHLTHAISAGPFNPLPDIQRAARSELTSPAANPAAHSGRMSPRA